MKHFTPLLAVLALILFGLNPAQAAKPRKVVLEPLPMHYGDSSRTADPFAKDPTVIRKGNHYLMYYSIRAFSEDRRPDPLEPGQGGWHAGIATSKDRVHWTRVGDIDVRDSHGQRVWGVVAPCVKRFGGKIHLFYQHKWEGASNSNNNIWHAVSRDGIHFTNTCDRPIFVPDAPWCTDRSIDAEIYRVKDSLILLFATRDKEMKVQMLGMARAPYRSDYGPDKWTHVTTEAPLMKPDYEWEGHCIEAPTVIRHKGIWYLFYAGAYNHEHQQIGLATSKDGIHFQRIEPDGLLFRAGEEGTWNHGESGHPGVFRDRNGKVYLFFQGKASLEADYFLSVCRVRFR